MAVATLLGSVWSRKAVELVTVRDPRYFTVVLFDSNPHPPSYQSAFVTSLLVFLLSVLQVHSEVEFLGPFIQMYSYLT
jgi:hypothetical protein